MGRGRKRSLGRALDLRVDAGADGSTGLAAEYGELCQRSADLVVDLDARRRRPGQRLLHACLDPRLPDAARCVVRRAELLELLGRDRPNRSDEVSAQLSRDRGGLACRLELRAADVVDVGRPGLRLQLVETRLGDREDRFEVARMLLGCPKRQTHLSARGAGGDQVAAHGRRLLDPLAHDADDHLSRLRGELSPTGAEDRRAGRPNAVDGNRVARGRELRIDGFGRPLHEPPVASLDQLDRALDRPGP